MSSSPFRDEIHALHSALLELQEENSALRTALSGRQAELEALRAQLPENIGPVMRRLQEENDELRSRLAEVEPRLAALASYEAMQRRTPDPTEAIVGALERLFARFVRK